MGRLFGTDGVRGTANEDITAEVALDLAVAAAHVLADAGEFEGHRPLAVVGTDGRASGEFLSNAVIAGLASAGISVFNAGMLPTPALAFLTADLDADLGVMISASHNPMPDNGIKFFARGGHKLDDQLEDAIEARMREPWKRPTGADVGRVHPLRDAESRYVKRLLSVLPNRLDGLHVVIDAAHGAASVTSPWAFREAGAYVTVIGAEPDGLNINDGYGSTHLARLQRAVVENGAQLGIAHDGDADRCLAVDAHGEIVDGDQIMCVLALALRERGELAKDTVVATVMSNLGMIQAMDRAGITIRQTAVGDRYVLEDMKSGGYSLGGEQSGHVIFLDHSNTGDGVLTGLMLGARLTETKRSLADLASVMTRLPQVLVNVAGVDKNAVDDDPKVQAAVAAAASDLGDTGRVLLRKSGTEPLVRVMVEACDQLRAEAVADQLAAVVRQRLTL
ncbi:MAG: phosphoglucosamine mutase [Actinomycetales bacterium]|nr:MAG: phosphoglucosamine mutase [Actinomycetales bacterium]